MMVRRDAGKEEGKSRNKCRYRALMSGWYTESKVAFQQETVE